MGPDGVTGKIVKLSWEAVIPYPAWLLDITVNNATVPNDRKRATVVPNYKKGDLSIVTSHRPVSLTSVVCRQMENVIAGYLRQVWDTNKWLYEGQHGFRSGYSCESQIVTVCQDIADFLDEEAGIDVIITDFSKAVIFVPYDRLLMKIATSGVDLKAVIWVKEFLFDHLQRVRVGRQLSEEVRVMSGVPQGAYWAHFYSSCTLCK